MDEDISIINSSTRNERIKNFLIENKKKLILLSITIIVSVISFFIYEKINEKKKISISNEYNSIIIEFSKNSKETTIARLLDLIDEKDPTYSLLSLYFILDNKLINDKEKINSLFNILINETSLEKEIKNLVIYKKGLFNADDYTESKLLDILKPVINSESVWKSHALYLMAEFFYAKGESEKAKEFFNQIINLEEFNLEIKLLAEKRLIRDLSE